MTRDGVEPLLNDPTKTVIGFINDIDDRNPNQNLLNNADFKLWQRGNALSNVSGGSYIADRWHTVGNTGSATFAWQLVDNKNSMRITNMNAPTSGIGQKVDLGNYGNALIENGEPLTMTISVKHDSANIPFQMGYVDSSGRPIFKSFTSTGDWMLASFTFPANIRKASNNLDILQVYPWLSGSAGASSPLNIAWAKLEKGERFTGFVENSLIEDWRECLPYFQNISSGYGRSYATNYSIVMLPTSATFRNAPTATLKTAGVVVLTYGTSAASPVPTGITYRSHLSGEIECTVNYAATNVGAGAAAILMGARIWFDAELY